MAEGLENFMSSEAMSQVSEALAESKEIKDDSSLERDEIMQQIVRENSVAKNSYEVGDATAVEKIEKLEGDATYMPFGLVDSQRFNREKDFKRTKEFYTRYRGNAQTILALEEYFYFQNLGERDKVMQVVEMVAGLSDLSDEEFQAGVARLRENGLSKDDIFKRGLNAILGAERAIAAIPPENLSSEHFNPTIDEDGNTIEPAILKIVVAQVEGETDRVSFVLKNTRGEMSRDVEEVDASSSLLPPFEKEN